MSSTLQRAPADLWDKWDSAQVTDLRPRPVEAMDEPPPPPQRSLGRRALRRSVRFVITLGLGIVGTLAWQAYGDDARQMMAMAYPAQLGWIAPQAAPDAPTQSAPATLASAAPAAPSVDQQQLNALSLNLAAMRQSVEQLATQVASAQQQMRGDIARLQASEQDILTKIATPPPRPAPVAARKPAPPPQALAPPPPAAQVR
jgi:pyruvate/2-oxoglutarate dehydrogenase complex dihydrolipoamide acyltransferase (E2) component